MPDGFDNPVTMRFLYGTTRTGLHTGNLMGPYVDPTHHQCQEEFRFSYERHQENKSLGGCEAWLELTLDPLLRRALLNWRPAARGNGGYTYSGRAARGDSMNHC
jgi:hypothetical protein